MFPWLVESFSWFIKGEAAWLDGFSCMEQKSLQRCRSSSAEVLGAGGTSHRGYENPVWLPLGFGCVRTDEQELFDSPQRLQQ